MIKILKKVIHNIFHGILNLGRKILSGIFFIKRKGEEAVEDFDKIRRGEEVDMSKYSTNPNDKALSEFEEERHKIESVDPELTQEEVDDIINALDSGNVVRIVEPEVVIHLDNAGSAKDYNVAAIEEIANRGLFYNKEVYIRREEEELTDA